MIRTRPSTVKGRSHDNPTTKTKCHFFRLPGELRNDIYEYILTDPRGLTCRVLSDGSSKFYTPDQRATERQEHKRRQPQWSQRRKNIRRKPEDIVINKLEANKLQYVCRQLRQETKALELRYNTIYFNSTNDAGVDVHCATFLASLSSLQISHLRQLVLYDHHGPDEPRKWSRSIFDAGKLAADYRSIRFAYCSNSLRQDRYYFLPSCTLLLAIARNEWSMYSLLTRQCINRASMDARTRETVDWNRARSADTKGNRKSLWPPNLRVFPRNSEAFDEKRFCEEIMWHYGSRIAMSCAGES